MSSTSTVVAIDGGQSSIRVRIQTGTIIEADRVFPPLLTNKALMPQLETVIRSVLPQRARGPIDIAAALSGLTPLNADAQGILSSCQDLGVSSVRLVHDSISGYLGCLGDRNGAAVAAGTGVVTLAAGPAGHARIDGWGNIMGDAGSGYWIGRAGLEAAMRAHDGRGQPTAILEILRHDFPNVENAYIDIQSNPDRIALVASYARSIIDLSTDDPAAAGIVDQATSELALSVGTGLRRTGWTATSRPAISWVGKILSNSLMAGPLQSKLERLWPNAQFVPPAGGPLDGVAQLVALHPRHALHSQLHIAANHDL